MRLIPDLSHLERWEKWVMFFSVVMAAFMTVVMVVLVVVGLTD